MEKCLFILILISFVLSVSLQNINSNTNSNEIGVNCKETGVLNAKLPINFNESDFNSHRIIRSPQFYPGYGGGFPGYGGIGAGYGGFGPGYGAGNGPGNVAGYGAGYGAGNGPGNVAGYGAGYGAGNGPGNVAGYGAGYGAGNGPYAGGENGRGPGGKHGGWCYNGTRDGGKGPGSRRGDGRIRGGGYGLGGYGGGGKDGRGGGGHGGSGWKGFGTWGRDGSFEEYSERQKRISDERYEEYWRRISATGMADDTEPLTLQDLNGRLVAAPGEYRHMAVIGLRGADRQKIWKCGGTLIDFYFILTAAHCTDFGGLPPTHVKVGDVNLKIRECTVATQRMRIEQIYRHPKYKDNSYYYDIALLRLSKPAIWTRHVRPARLWVYNDYPINRVYALGYGATQFGKAPVDVLTFLNLTMISNKICKATLPAVPETKNGIIESQMCAIDLEGNADTCQGDSGGPLQLHLPGRRRTKYYIVGITSYGLFCGSKTPSVYTRIYPFLEWIESIVWTQYNKKK